MESNSRTSARVWLGIGLATIGIATYAAAMRFALRYRERVGLPHPSKVEDTPDKFDLPFESVEIASGDATLAGWFIPASPDAAAPAKRRRTKAAAAVEPTLKGEPLQDETALAGWTPFAAGTRPGAEPRPGIVIVHGWESNRGRSLAHARHLHAAGFHCLVIDVRGHGDNRPETVPLNVPEFAADAIAAARWLGARSEVSAVGLLGHSMGGAGCLVAASRDPLIRAVAALSTPADLVLMTRKTFEMAGAHIPDALAMPLAWITARTLIAPRGRSLAEASALVAVTRYRGPLLLAHGADDHGVPVEHLRLLARAAESARDESDPTVETIVVPGLGHRFLYSDAELRGRVAGFFAAALGGPVTPDRAAALASKQQVERPAEPGHGFGALQSQPSGS